MAPKSPKISIVVPSYNQGEFLEATLQSILSQNFPNIELIVIDGGSTDRSLDIIKKYENQISFWCSEPDNGHYDAINKGFTHSSGEIMAWLNSDDMYYPWTLKTVASIMDQFHEVEWLTTLNAGWWDREGYHIGYSQIPGFSKEAFLDGRYIPWGKNQLGWIQQESTFWKRSLWKKVGSQLELTYPLAGDFNLWTKFYRHAELYGTPSPLAGFRSYEDQRSAQKQNYTQEAERALKQYRDLENWKEPFDKTLLYKLRLHKIPRIKELVLFNMGYIGKRIVRKNSDTSVGSWDIENYRFI